MPEPVNEGEVEVKVAEVDAFGNPSIPPEPIVEKEVEKEVKKGEIDENHPLIVGLKQQIEDVKKEYGGNLSGQRDVIKNLENKIKELEGGKKQDEIEVLYKDIKRSKDLSAEEREEMTDTEIKQMDQIADMQEAQNKMYVDMQKKNKAEEGKETGKVEDLNTLVRETAMELAGDDVAVANQIIEATKQFVLTDLPADKVKERVANATKLVPNYKAPKEQKKVNGKPVKGTGTSDDPFGVNKIIEEATKGSGGTYSL